MVVKHERRSFGCLIRHETTVFLESPHGPGVPSNR